MATMIASQTSVRGHRVPAYVCVCCIAFGMPFQRTENGRVGVNTLREHATSVQARRKTHHLLLPPSLCSASLTHISDMHRWARARAAPSSTRISAPPIIVGRVQLVRSASRVRLLREDTRKGGCGSGADRHCRVPVSERAPIPQPCHT